MTRKEYNGWTNYETWAVKLWMDNDEWSYRDWKERTEACIEATRNENSAFAHLTKREIFSHTERAKFALARQLKDEFKEANPVTEASVWADLMNAALGEVNWDEIAGSLIADSSVELEAKEEATI